MTEIKLCPLCGSKAKMMHSTFASVTTWIIACERYECSVEIEDYESEDEVIRKWNLRFKEKV